MVSGNRRECIEIMHSMGRGVLTSCRTRRSSWYVNRADLPQPMVLTNVLDEFEPWPSPFIHLVHPFSLKNFLESLSHVKRFNTFLRSLSARSENSRHAQETLADLVDSSGINLDALENGLTGCLQIVEELPGRPNERIIPR